MGHSYRAVLWNANKIIYDIVALAALLVFLGVFMIVGLRPDASGHTADPVVLLIRALGSAAFVMITLLLCIGPLARQSPRFLPFLYNRRHLGVMTFTVAAAHAGLTLAWYHAGGPLNPLTSLFVSGLPGDPFPGIQFELFGFAALMVLFLLAVTSHDFWLNNLSAPVWKALHMLVYPAYGAILLHVAYGFLATETAVLYPPVVFASFALVVGLHVAAGLREWRIDSALKTTRPADGWITAGPASSIPDQRAVIVALPKGDRVAVFRDGARIFALDNACRHQNGPLGEGCIKDGLVTCPWHGWQYRPHDGVSPPPYTERVATFDVRAEGETILVRIKPNPLGRVGASVVIASLEGSMAP